MPKQTNLVQTWLTAIGLSKAIVQTFEAAGIVHPRDLAELDVCHYPALGVKEAGDRKKLFYLIQRVKMAVPDDDEEAEEDIGTGSTNTNTSRRQRGEDEGTDVPGVNVNMNTTNNTSRKRTTNRADANADIDLSLETSTSHSSWQHAGEKTGDGDETDEGVGSSPGSGPVSSAPRRILGEKGGSVDLLSSERAVVHLRSSEDHEDDDDLSDYDDTFDQEEDDGIDEALEEQYKPLLSNSFEEDYHTGDEYTSSEAVPSPPSTPQQQPGRLQVNSSDHDDIDNMDMDINSIDMGMNVTGHTEDDVEEDENLMLSFDMGLDPGSPLRMKREEDFLKRRNERLKLLTPPRKSKPPAPEKKQTKKKGGTGSSAPAGATANKRMTRSKSAAASSRNNAASNKRASIKEKMGGMFRSQPGTKGASSTSNKKRASQTPLRRILGKATGGINNSGKQQLQEHPPSPSRYNKASADGAMVKVRVRSKSSNRSRGRVKDSENMSCSSSPSNKTRRQTLAKLQQAKLYSRNRGHDGDSRGRSVNSRVVKMDMEPILVKDEIADSEQESHAEKDLSHFTDDEEEERVGGMESGEVDIYHGDTDLESVKDDDEVENNSLPMVEPGHGSPTARRISKRLQEKKLRNMFSSASTTSANKNDDGLNNSGNSSLGSRKSGSAKSDKVSSSSSRRVGLDDSGDDHDHLPPTLVSNIPSSKIVRSSSARDRTSKLQNFMGRESKRLSTIPSGISAPMSPPLMSSVADLDDDLEIHPSDDVASLSSVRSGASASSRKSFSKNRIKQSNKSRRPSLSNEDKYSKNNSSDLGRAKSTPRNRTSTSGSMEAVPSYQVKSTSDLDVASLKAKSFEEKEKNRDADRGHRNANTKTGNQSSGAVFVHGGKPDKSWASQVNFLRESYVQRHEKETGGDIRRDYEEEMRIRVIVRKRPMSKKEASKKGEVDVIHPLRYSDYGRILVFQPKTRVDLTKEVEALPFAFDNVFTEISNNCEIYDETIKPLIPGAFEGRWASVFAYGQTGSGKTFTMMGSTLTGIKAKTRNVEHEKNYGLYLLAARDLFEFANRPEYSHLSVGASLFEIYGGKLFDLLNDRAPVKCLENHKGRVCFPGLSEHPIGDANELMLLIEAGSSNRSTGSTSANRDSSRSHAVLQLHLRKSVGKKHNVEHGRLTFIDLAGSERGADTNKACRTTRQEGADINVSLLALKEVIRALATGDSMTHIPFRGSKLTQVLKEGFVGKNSRTVMVACIAPNMTNCDHTLNTLRYADRVKERNAESGQLTADVARASKIHTKSSRPASAASVNNELDRRNNPSHSNKSNIDANVLSDEDEVDDDNWLSDLDKEDIDDEGDLPFDPFNEDDEGMDELNEVLESPVATKLDSTNFFEDDENKATSTKQKNKKKTSPMAKSPSRLAPQFKTKKEAVAPLVGAHRSIMTEMLSMVKQEMTLVNCTDGDRELIDEYLDELEQIQDKQLSMISTLRESLVQYYAQRPNVNGSDNRHDNGINRKPDKPNQGSIFQDDSFDDLRSPF